MISATFDCVDVEAGDVESGLGELDGKRQADVAEADDADPWPAAVRASPSGARVDPRLTRSDCLTGRPRRRWRAGDDSRSRSASTIISIEAFEVDLRLPAEDALRLGGVADQVVDFGRAQQRRDRS